jgi:hypothetical protein
VGGRDRRGRDAVIEAWNVLDATLHDDEENVG